MKRSPLNSASPGGRPYGARHTPYNWKSPGGSCGRGYLSADDNNYQRFSASGAGSQPCDGDFIPLDISTPMRGTTPQHDKFNAANRYSPSGGNRGSPGSGWYNFKGNYYTSPRSNGGNRYPNYQHSPRFRGQKKKDYKGAHRQVNVSAYVDMNSFLEDPWENLVKKLDNSKDTSKSKELENESLLSNSKLTTDLTEISGSKLLKDMNLDESQSSQEHTNTSSVDVSFKEQNTDISQASKVNTSVESEIGDTCFDQNSPNESTCSVNDKICGVMQENSIHLNASLTDTDQKEI